MIVPDRYRPVLGPESLGVEVDDRGVPRPSGCTTYPPPGFVPFTGAAWELGNGDVYGFYWPVGREEASPLVCLTEHDDWALAPVASTLEDFVRHEAADARDAPGIASFRREVARTMARALQLDVSDSTACPPAEALEIHARSPEFLAHTAYDALKRGDLVEAERGWREALAILPEYTAVLELLGRLRRRQRDANESAHLLLDALGSPGCFRADRQGTLQAVQRLRDEDHLELAGNPLWCARHRLTFKQGVKRSDDYAVLDEVIEQHLKQGDGVQAVRLRIVYGERMAGETVAFRERYGFTPEAHLARLRAETARAGLSSRA